MIRDALGPVDHWYAVAWSLEVRRKPVQRWLLGQPLSVWRGPEGVQAREVHALRHAAVDQDGLVWVFGRAGATPVDGPSPLPPVDDDRYLTVRLHTVYRCGLQEALENSLDVPHTAFVHAGLFRGLDGQREVNVDVQAGPDGVRAHYLDEVSPRGLVGRLLAPPGSTFWHVDRFTLPANLEVAYRLHDSHLVACVYNTPLQADATALFVVIRVRLRRVPHVVLGPALRWLGHRVLAQDAHIVAAQARAQVARGPARHLSTELDTFTLWVRRSVDLATNGRPPLAHRSARVVFRT